MTKLLWSQIVAVVTVSVLASQTAAAQTVQWPTPLPSRGVPEVRPQSAVILNRESSEVVRLPPVGSPSPLASVSRHGIVNADGTWSEDGRHLVINLNGQQLRLVRADLQTSPNSATSENLGGDVSGRLSHHGRPLVNCEIALVALRKSWTGYSWSKSGELLARTDGNGWYYLRNVPAGPYKLKWRPVGEASWIRRAEIRPDVRVRARETSRVKEIRVALQTIN